MSNDNSQFAWNIHGYLNSYIKFGDTKAALLSGLTGPLIVGLIGVSGWKLKWDYETLFLLLSILLFAIAFGFAFSAIWPNLFTNKLKRTKAIPTSIKSEGNETPDQGFIYWKNIRAHTNANTFCSELAKLTDEEKLGHIGNHCYELAGITDRKYWLITVSSHFFAAGLIALIIFAAVHCGNNSEINKKSEPLDSSQPLTSLGCDVSTPMPLPIAPDLFV